MARPIKNGLDYFPFDTKPDMKMNAVIRKYGATGLGCLIGLYQKIYDNGYFIKADFDFIEDLCLELRIEDEDYLKEFIRFCVKKNIFDRGFYESDKVLTSNGIQKRFNEATKRRKCTHDVSNYLVNVCNNPVNVCNNPVNVNKSTQSKVKESKGKEIIKTKAKKSIPPTLQEVKEYCEKRSNSIDPEKFISHYDASGWMRGKTKIKDWQACVRTWEGNSNKSTAASKTYYAGHSVASLNILVEKGRMHQADSNEINILIEASKEGFKPNE